jgi:hypothetical protein
MAAVQLLLLLKRSSVPKDRQAAVSVAALLLLVINLSQPIASIAWLSLYSPPTCSWKNLIFLAISSHRLTCNQAAELKTTPESSSN